MKPGWARGECGSRRNRRSARGAWEEQEEHRSRRSTRTGGKTSDTQLKESDPKVACSSVNKYTNYKPCTKRSKCDADVDINLQSTSVSKRIKLDSASQRTAPKSMPHINGVENKLSNFGSGEIAAHTEAMACNQQNKCSKGAVRVGRVGVVIIVIMIVVIVMLLV